MKTIVSTTQPEFTDLGDEWYNPDENALYKLLAIDGKTVTWVELADPRIYESLVEDAENTITALDETTLQTITSGQESSKPSSDSIGKLRFNTTANNLETYGINWVGINPTFVEATGGIIETADGYRTHIFTSTSNLVVSALSTDTSLNQVEYLVVAGGGGGGNAPGGAGGGGGGAGGFRTGTISLIGLGNVLAQVGAGGAINANGIPSIFGNTSLTSEVIESAGGGRGGVGDSGPPTGSGISGGSGGGTGTWSKSPTVNNFVLSPIFYGAGLGNTPKISDPQGFPGSSVVHNTPTSTPTAPATFTGYSAAGGGGGAGGRAIPGDIWGTDQPSDQRPHARNHAGGPGRVSYLSPPLYGTPGPAPGRYFAGGGGSGGYRSSGVGPVAPGGGGRGSAIGGSGSTAPSITPTLNGNTNTGGGGGGSSANGAPTNLLAPASQGGSGIVIIRYKYNYPKVIK